MDEFQYPKRLLGGLLLELFDNDKEEILKLISRTETRQDFETKIATRESIKRLYIIEMIDRLAKEPRITVEATERIKHTASKNEIDFTVILIICISSLMGLRYMGSEFGEDGGAFRLIGGLALVFAIFARPIFRSLKRKWL